MSPSHPGPRLRVPAGASEALSAVPQDLWIRGAPMEKHVLFNPLLVKRGWNMLEYPLYMEVLMGKSTINVGISIAIGMHS